MKRFFKRWFRMSPLTRKKWQRFKSLRRGYYSLLIMVTLILIGAGAELVISHRALLVKYDGRLYFPTYGKVIPGTTFGFDYDYETNYRDLQVRLKEANGSDFVIMPPVPYNPYEIHTIGDAYPPYPPDFATKHYLGTDTVGRDILARLLYGFRTAISFALLLMLCNYVIGVSLGCAMGYFGGNFDLGLQRVIEIWSNIPFLYVVIIVSSLVTPTFNTLVAIMMFFGWMSMTWYMRSVTYKEKARDYTMAARAIGCSDARIMFRHILPNTISVIVTFIPFSISSGIVALTSLDYLGFGLPPPTPSWGELLSQGTANMSAVWIATSVVTSMVIVLTMVTFIGEAIREAFDPKKFSTYE